MRALQGMVTGALGDFIYLIQPSGIEGNVAPGNYRGSAFNGYKNGRRTKKGDQYGFTCNSTYLQKTAQQLGCWIAELMDIGYENSTPT